jgi:3-dehydroquinate dehydratase/shikimate dehydrogenase
VNTLVPRGDGTWEGENTDALGAVTALENAARLPGGRLRGQHAAILGAGGVARAVIAALQERGCTVTIYNRTPERAMALAQELRCAWGPWETRATLDCDILINCTAVGLWPAVDESPLPEAALRPEMIVFDTIYRPASTRLLQLAHARGCETVSGVDMFVAQAAAQFERWHARAAPISAMKAALERVTAGKK